MKYSTLSSRRKRRFGKTSTPASGRERGRRASLLFEPLEIRNLLAGDLLSDFAFDSPVDGQQVVQMPVSAPAASLASVPAAEGEAVAEGEDAPDLVAFAKALTDAGVKYFGAAWCTHCTTQKELFQDGADYLPFIEVTNPDRSLNEVGQQNNITSFPTWQFPDQSREVGQLDLQTISQRSGVPIPTSSDPFIKPIEDTTLLAGSPLHVALDGYDPNGNPLTYTVTSDNPLVTPTLLTGNRSMRIDVNSWGDMVFQLFEQRASRPTSRVIELAVDGFYDGIIFHRVIDGFVIQGGDPTGTGSGGSTLGDFDDQFNVDLQHNRSGTLSYAKSSDDTNDSQFFVTLGATRHLDFNHSIFGQLVEGQHVLEAIGHTATDNSDRPLVNIAMNTIEIFQDTENGMVMLKADPAAVGQQANITVTVSDGTGNSVQETFKVTVAADTINGGPFLNDLPVFETSLGTPVQIPLTATDVEGDAVYFDASATGSVTYTLDVDHTTGVVTVTPPADYVGPLDVLVGVRAADGSDTSDTWDRQTVRVNVVQDTPVLDLLAASDSNIDNDNVTNVTNMTFRVSNVTSGATVQVLLDGSVIGQGTASGTSIDITTNNLAALGDGTYELTAVQTVGGETSDPSNALTVTLDTTPPAAFTSTPPTTATNGIQVVYNAEHPEEGTTGFSYSMVGAPSGAVIEPASGVMNWTPTLNQGGTQNFQIVATDLAGNSRSQELSIDVTVVDQEVLIELVVVDDQENPITEISSGEEFWVFAYVQDLRDPALGVFAAYVDITYDTSVVSVMGTSLNDIIFGNKYQNGKSGSLATPGLVNEVGAFGPTSPTGSGKELLFAIPFRADQSGDVTFQLDPSDGAGHEVLVFGENQPVAWNAVTLTNAALTVDAGLAAIDDLFNVDEDSVNFPLDVLDNDTNEIGGEVTITQVGGTSQGGTVTIAGDGKSLLYSPPANFFGEETFTYTIANGGLTSTADVTVQVAPINDAPTAVNDALTVDSDSQQNFLDVLGNDLIAPDQNETLRVISVGTTSHGGTVTIGPNGTHLLYTPAAGFSGNEIFTYTIRDRASTATDGLTSTATVTMTVENVLRPTADNDTATVDEDSTQNEIDVLDGDTPVVAGADLTVISVTQSKFGGTVSIAQDGKSVFYTPSPDFFGTDTFTYTIREEDGETATASVTVTVNPTNDPPTAHDDTFQISKNAGAKDLNVLANDTIEPDTGETLIITAVTQGSQGGTIAIAQDGKTVIYTQSTNASLPDTYTETFTYTIDDGSGETDVATVTVTVRPYVPRNISGNVIYAAVPRAIGGLNVNLDGTDDFDASVALSYMTMADGSYTFADLAPGNYTITTGPAVFLQEADLELTIESADDDGDSPNNDFIIPRRDPAYVSIADFLTRAPGQSSISPQDSVMIAAEAGGAQRWYSYQAGWQNYMQLETELSEDATQLTLNATDNDGQQYQGTVSLADSSKVKHLGESNGSHLFRIDAGPQELNLQPVAASSATTSGEAEATVTAVMENAPGLASAEGEAAAPVFAAAVADIEDNSWPGIGLGETTVATAVVPQDVVGIDLVTPTLTTTVDTQASQAADSGAVDAIDAVWAAEGSDDEIVQPEFELFASAGSADEYALAIDAFLASDLS